MKFANCSLVVSSIFQRPITLVRSLSATAFLGMLTNCWGFAALFVVADAVCAASLVHHLRMSFASFLAH